MILLSFFPKKLYTTLDDRDAAEPKDIGGRRPCHRVFQRKTSEENIRCRRLLADFDRVRTLGERGWIQAKQSSCPEGLSLEDDVSLATQGGEEAFKSLRIVTLFEGEGIFERSLAQVSSFAGRDGGFP